jgi:hypothetical protein
MEHIKEHATYPWPIKQEDRDIKNTGSVSYKDRVLYNRFALTFTTKLPFGSSNTLPGNQLDSLQIHISLTHYYLIC